MSKPNLLSGMVLIDETMLFVTQSFLLLFKVPPTTEEGFCHVFDVIVFFYFIFLIIIVVAL